MLSAPFQTLGHLGSTMHNCHPASLSDPLPRLQPTTVNGIKSARIPPQFHLGAADLIPLSGSLLKRSLRVMTTHLPKLESQPRHRILDASPFTGVRLPASVAPGSRSLSIAQALKHPIISGNSIALATV